ncbi:MAG: 50S ribosomal protein L31 [Patescibacteria group bacterium]
MKAKVHPKYYDNCQVTCSCGNTFVTGSVLEKISVNICSACHPFYVGKAKFVDSEGRIERFERKRQEALKNKGKSKKSKKSKKIIDPKAPKKKTKVKNKVAKGK